MEGKGHQTESRSALTLSQLRVEYLQSDPESELPNVVRLLWAAHFCVDHNCR